MKAVWNGEVIAESDDTVLLEGNYYFPPAAVRRQWLRSCPHHSVCPWKGTASYYDLVVNGKVNSEAAWYYPEPSAEAQRIAGRIAFWHGVEVVP